MIFHYTTVSTKNPFLFIPRHDSTLDYNGHIFTDPLQLAGGFTHNTLNIGLPCIPLAILAMTPEIYAELHVVLLPALLCHKRCSRIQKTSTTHRLRGKGK